MKCLVCGKETMGVKMKHGVIPICVNVTCFQKVDLEAFRSVPVIWVGEEDFVEHRIASPEEAKGLDIRALGDSVAEYLWEATNLGAVDFDKALRFALEGEELSQVENSKPEDLPLMIGKLKYEESKRLLAVRLREGK